MPPQFLKIAVDRLFQSADSLQRLFQANHQDEVNRPRLRDGMESTGGPISKSLSTLAKEKGAVAAAIKVPNGAYNQFIATWNNGSGDLARSNARLNEFWTLLHAGKPEIDKLIALTPGERNPDNPGAKPTPEDHRHFLLIIDVADALRTSFEGCVKVHNDAVAKNIATRVSQIVELLSKSKTPGAVAGLQAPKALWAEFTTAYNRGRGINQKSLVILKNFVGRMQALARG